MRPCPQYALVLLCVSLYSCGVGAQLDSDSLSDKLKQLSQEAMGEDYIQQLFDEEAVFQTSRILDLPDKGQSLAKKVRQSLYSTYL